MGAGGLGSALVLCLNACDDVSLTVIDDDRVALSNLQRQILHRTADVGQPKIASLRRLRVPCRGVAQRLDSANAESLLHGAALVLDGSDNFATRFLVNDTAVRLGIPFVFAGVQRYFGQVLPVIPGRSACYRCIFVEPPGDDAALNCSGAGVLGAFVGVIAALQARAGLALLREGGPGSASEAAPQGGMASPAPGRLLTIDLTTQRWRQLSIDPRPDCPACAALRLHKGAVDAR